MWLCPELSAAAHLQHGFFGRKGGVSKGIYSSLNCGYGSGDNHDAVSENRLIACLSAGISSPLITCSQIHSSEVIIADSAWSWQNSPQADAIVTTRSNIAIGVLTADCLPVLFADHKRRIVGAAHAGWRGALAGILKATVQAMRKLGAEDIIAAIGPSIQQDSYEVSNDFFALFIKEDAANKVFFKASANAGHYLFNLPEYARKNLQDLQISTIGQIKRDTYLDDTEFFSYRRTMANGEKNYGRQISMIAISEM